MKKSINRLNIFNLFYIFLIILLFIIIESVCDTDPEYHYEYEYDEDTDDQFIHRGYDVFQERKYRVRHSGYSPAKFGKFPFVVAVFNGKNKEKTCGGIILNDMMVLTAGNCIIECRNQPEMISILGGVVDMNDHIRDQWRYGSEIIFYHKNYNDIPYLTGIKVNSPFYLHYLLQAKPIPITPFSSNDLCYLSTWHLKDRIRTIISIDHDDESIVKSSILKYIQAHPIDRNLCHRMYDGYDNEIVNLEEILCLPDTDQPITMTNQSIFDNKTGHRSNDDGIDLPQTCVGSDGTILSCSNPDGILIPIAIATSVPGGFFCTDKPNTPTSFFDLGKFVTWIKEKLFETPGDFDKMQNSLSKKQPNLH